MSVVTLAYPLGFVVLLALYGRGNRGAGKGLFWRLLLALLLVRSQVRVHGSWELQGWKSASAFFWLGWFMSGNGGLAARAEMYSGSASCMHCLVPSCHARVERC